MNNEDSKKLDKVLEVLESQCKPCSNKIVAAFEYKEHAQGDLILPQFIEKCKLVTKACNFGEVEDKCLRNAILLGLSNHKVYEKCIQKAYAFTLKDVTKIVVSDEEYQLWNSSSNCSSKPKNK